MKLKLAILEKDIIYLNKIVSVFENKYSDSLQMFAFTDETILMKEINKNKIDVFLADEDFEINISELPKRCGFAYLTDNIDKTEVRNSRAIAKFQKVDLIYKEIISIYSDVAEDYSGNKNDENSHTRTILFTSPAGGTGTSVLAVAYAKRMARAKRVVYITLNPLDKTELFFDGDGTTDFGDIIFALKSQNGNLKLKIEGTVRKDNSGVDFFASTKTSLDMMELNSEEIIRLFNELIADDKYDYIVIDSPFSIKDEDMGLYELSDRIIMVSDGIEITNTKTVRAIDTVDIIQNKKELNLSAKIGIIYNRFSSKQGKVLEGTEIESIGGIARYENASAKQIVEQISNMQMLDNIR